MGFFMKFFNHNHYFNRIIYYECSSMIVKLDSRCLRKTKKSKDLHVEEFEAPAAPWNGPQCLNFRDIRNNFGINHSETSRLPMQQSLFGAKNSADEVDSVEMHAEEEHILDQQILREMHND